MVCDDLCQIIRFGSFGNDRRRVRYVLKQRPVRKERAARDEHDPRIRLTVANEVRSCDRAPIFQHDI